jgi:hypothetical protein
MKNYLITERKDFLPSEKFGIVIKAKNQLEALKYCNFDQIISEDKITYAINEGVKIYALELDKNKIIK